MSADWRNIGANIDREATPTEDGHVPFHNCVDLPMQYRVQDGRTFQLAANIIFDIDRPIIGSRELPDAVGKDGGFRRAHNVLSLYLVNKSHG